MEKHKQRLLWMVCLGLLTVASCIAAEFKRAKLKDMKLDGRQCHMARSDSYWYGIAGLACWSTALVSLSLMVWSIENRTPKRKMLSLVLVMSWVSFGMGVVLMGSATSMSGRQPYGRGWLDGECYVVKDGIFAASAILASLSFAFMLTSLHQRSKINHPP